MKDLLKKVSIGGYITVAAAFLAIVGAIVALVSCSPAGFMIVQMPWIVILTLLAVVGIVFAIYFAAKKGENIISTIVIIAVTIALTLTLFLLIGGKEDVLGTVLFSELERGFAPAEHACYVGVAAMVIYIVSIVALIVGSFFSLVKKEKDA